MKPQVILSRSSVTEETSVSVSLCATKTRPESEYAGAPGRGVPPALLPGECPWVGVRAVSLRVPSASGATRRLAGDRPVSALEGGLVGSVAAADVILAVTGEELVVTVAAKQAVVP